ncbi:MAG TPA: AAA family ATPase [archaeon]|nr:AAA family ATPase [archaeon]
MKPFACIITGTGGSGKTATANQLAKMFKKTAVVEVDSLRQMVKNGYSSPNEGKKAGKQLRLATNNSIAIARNFLKEGFTVFIDDVLLSGEAFKYYEESLKGYKVHVFALLPHERVLRGRLRKRKETKKWTERFLTLHERFHETKSAGHWHSVDNSRLNAKQTAAAIAKIAKGK